MTSQSLPLDGVDSNSDQSEDESQPEVNDDDDDVIAGARANRPLVLNPLPRGAASVADAGRGSGVEERVALVHVGAAAAVHRLRARLPPTSGAVRASVRVDVDALR